MKNALQGLLLVPLLLLYGCSFQPPEGTSAPSDSRSNSAKEEKYRKEIEEQYKKAMNEIKTQLDLDEAFRFGEKIYKNTFFKECKSSFEDLQFIGPKKLEVVTANKSKAPNFLDWSKLFKCGVVNDGEKDYFVALQSHYPLDERGVKSDQVKNTLFFFDANDGSFKKQLDLNFSGLTEEEKAGITTSSTPGRDGKLMELGKFVPLPGRILVTESNLTLGYTINLKDGNVEVIKNQPGSSTQEGDVVNQDKRVSINQNFYFPIHDQIYSIETTKEDDGYNKFELVNQDTGQRQEIYRAVWSSASTTNKDQIESFEIVKIEKGIILIPSGRFPALHIVGDEIRKIESLAISHDESTSREAPIVGLKGNNLTIARKDKEGGFTIKSVDYSQDRLIYSITNKYVSSPKLLDGTLIYDSASEEAYEPNSGKVITPKPSWIPVASYWDPIYGNLARFEEAKKNSNGDTIIGRLK